MPVRGKSSKSGHTERPPQKPQTDPNAGAAISQGPQVPLEVIIERAVDRALERKMGLPQGVPFVGAGVANAVAPAPAPADLLGDTRKELAHQRERINQARKRSHELNNQLNGELPTTEKYAGILFDLSYVVEEMIAAQEQLRVISMGHIGRV